MFENIKFLITVLMQFMYLLFHLSLYVVTNHLFYLFMINYNNKFFSNVFE